MPLIRYVIVNLANPYLRSSTILLDECATGDDPGNTSSKILAIKRWNLPQAEGDLASGEHFPYPDSLPDEMDSSC